MYCIKCGAQIEEGANFCTKCGAPVDGAAVEQAETYDLQQVGARPVAQKPAKVWTIFAGIGFGVSLGSIILFWIGAYVTFLFGPIGLVFSILGKKSDTKKKLATTGVILSIIAMILSFIFFIITIVALIEEITSAPTPGYYPGYYY